MDYGLTAMVSRSLEVTEEEANIIIDEQASIGRDMLDSGNCDIEDIEELMYNMGVEPDYLDEFLLRMC
jgi:hypothetical protein